jgi:hypothetical protein
MSRPGLTNERLVALFLLGVLLFTPPLLWVFNTPDRILGLPRLYLYLFAAWTLLIVLVMIVIERSPAEEGSSRAVEAPTGGAEPAGDGTPG